MRASRRPAETQPAPRSARKASARRRWRGTAPRDRTRSSPGALPRGEEQTHLRNADVDAFNASRYVSPARRQYDAAAFLAPAAADILSDTKLDSSMNKKRRSHAQGRGASPPPAAAARAAGVGGKEALSH